MTLNLTLVLRILVDIHGDYPEATEVLDRVAREIISQAVPATANLPSPDRTLSNGKVPARSAWLQTYQMMLASGECIRPRAADEEWPL